MRTLIVGWRTKIREKRKHRRDEPLRHIRCRPIRRVSSSTVSELALVLGLPLPDLVEGSVRNDFLWEIAGIDIASANQYGSGRISLK